MIPESRIPFIYVDFDNSRAIHPGAAQSYNVLLIGQKLDASSSTSLTPTFIRNEKDVADLFGYGSMLHLMAKGIASPLSDFIPCEPALPLNLSQLEFLLQ